MSAVEELNSGDTSPLKGPAPKAEQEDTSELDKNEDIMPLTSPGDQAVQFIPGSTPANGDAKVEIGDATTPQFVGLGKEELLRYASDPFWVRLRWFLFILFWVLWVAMLAGAIIIIVLAPKCAEKNKAAPETYYQLNVKNFAKDGKLKDLGERAEYLSGLGMSSVIISDVLKKDEGGTVDFKDVDESYGTTDEFSEAINKLKKAGMKVLMTLVPNHSGTKHEWFSKPEFEDFYIRRHTQSVFGSPWSMVDSTKDPAWSIDPTNSSMRYLQLFSGKNADLNYLNEKVVKEMKGAFTFWKEKGVEAFVIPAASYLIEDLEKIADAGATRNQPQNVQLVKTLVNRKSDAPVSLVEVDGTGLTDEDRSGYISNGFIPLTTDFDFSKRHDQYSSIDTKIGFFKSLHAASPSKVTVKLSELHNQNKDEANIIRFLVYTSNASVLLEFGDEVEGYNPTSPMDWTKATEATKGVTYQYLQKLTTAQKSLVDSEEKPKYEYPTFKRNVEQENQNAFVFVRSNKYYGLVNFASREMTIHFQSNLDIEPFKSTIVVATPNAGFDEEDMKEHLRESVHLAGRSAVLLRKAD